MESKQRRQSAWVCEYDLDGASGLPHLVPVRFGRLCGFSIHRCVLHRSALHLNPYGYTDANLYPNSDVYGNFDSYKHPYADRHLYSHLHTNQHGDVYPYIHTHLHADEHTHSDADTFAS
jgi:hypothetical protein